MEMELIGTDCAAFFFKKSNFRSYNMKSNPPNRPDEKSGFRDERTAGPKVGEMGSGAATGTADLGSLMRGKMINRDDCNLRAQHLLFAGDIACGIFGFILAGWVRTLANSFFGLEFDLWATVSENVLFFVLMLAAIPYCLDKTDSYLAYHGKSFTPVFLKTRTAILYWIMAMALFDFALQSSPDISRSFLILSVLFTFVNLLAFRRYFHRQCLAGKVASMSRRILYIGVSPTTKRILDFEKATDPRFADHNIGVLTKSGNNPASKYGLRRLGGIDDLESLLERGKDIKTVIVSEDVSSVQLARISYLCEREMVRLMITPPGQGMGMSSIESRYIGSSVVLDTRSIEANRLSASVIKRVMDLCVAVPMAILTLPVVSFFALLVYLESPGHSVIYRQRRVGFRGKEFDLLKIRSMRPDAEAGGAGWSVKDDPRALRVGAFIRKWNIDELPQFWNVIFGELSLVGPRPERPEHVQNFKHEVSNYNARHFVRPGLTGLAQVRGWRGDTCLNKRIECDLEYMSRWSVSLDFWILLRTAGAFKNAY